ncbi:MAG: Dihydroorotase, multifunctional complex type [Candidatus Roizmanbacteria bacterium GW2011_GWA2_34_18]|uniref:Dihydroorotase, multifunctional complex type n=1 Tax=Candidatus Roizmanbacteria bacterium GW2011_GWA2_34_18 TaxID=1618477 RepID=A0A0G0DZJ6_9BACT|nr:MAG: Dihydroorotase, multifunctional complex type [Candidatus Roizmanbacteria bacterium GW2011_GWA2_34_18]
MKKLIKNGKIVTPEKIINGDILIEDGKIKEIIDNSKVKGSTLKFFDGKQQTAKNLMSSPFQVVDAKGKYILPGLIEVHGHLREPGFEQKEDVPHGTRAGIAGGFTSVIDMPNTKPPTTTVALLQDKIKKIYPGRSYIDYAFFMGVASDKLDELKKVNPKDIVGVKVFMAGNETFKKTGRTDAGLWSEIRPTSVVASAAARAIAMADIYGTELYLLHLSTPEEFALVAAAKKRGLKVYGELVGYQLMFNTNDYKKYGNKIKVAPALRTPEDQKKMWEFVRSGRINVICSEHTPHEWETKNQPDMWKAQAGTPGIQETLPALITGWTKHFGKNTLEEGLMKISKYCSLNPAKIFGFSSKGSISVGKDADLVILDPDSVWPVKKSDLFSKCGWSAYEGMKLSGRPEKVFLRGELVYNNGKILGDPKGKWINH